MNEVRPYQLGDEMDIVELLDQVFEGWPHFDINCSPLDHWEWKYQGNPMKSSYISVVKSSGKIIGCSHAIPLTMKIGDNIFHGSNAYDLAVHPSFRKRGIGKKLTTLRDELRKRAGIDFALVESGNPILIKRHEEKFPPFPGKIKFYVKIQNIDLQMKTMQNGYNWLMKYGFKFANFFNKLINIFRKGVSFNDEMKILKINSFDDRINKFWENIKRYYNFIIVRKKEYLNWRYCDFRGGDFLVKIAEENRQIQGYIVTRINRFIKSYPEGYIIDLLTYPNRLDVAEMLIDDALHYFRNNDVNIIKLLMVETHPYEKMLKKYGFLYSREKMYVYYKIFNDVVEGLKILQFT